ncbi:MAG: tetratricopeptide repeat protein [Bacteroidota bacterium]
MFRIKAVILSLMLLIAASSYAQVNLPHFVREGRIALYNNNYTEAVQHFNEVISRKANPFEEYFYRGIAKYNLGDYLGAEHDFSMTLDIHPFYSRAYHYRGVTYAALMEKGKAIEDLNKALELDPYNSEALASRGGVFLQMEQYQKALDDFNEALMIDRDVASVYLRRAIVQKELENYVEALKDCSTAIEKKMFYKEAYAQRGLIKYEMGWFEKALSDFNSALKIDNQNAEYYYFRALTRYQLNDLEGTLADYGKALERNPSSALTYYNRAILYSQIKDYEKAIKDYEKVAALNPNNILTYFNRAHLYYELEDYKAAIDDYSKAIEIFPQFARAYLMRAQAYQKTGLMEEARHDRRKGNQLIAMHDDSQSNEGNRTAWIDSTYFEKIIEFESGFRKANIGTGKSNKRDTPIEPLHDFRYSLVPHDFFETEKNRDAFISEFNQEEKYEVKIMLSTEWSTIKKDRLSKLYKRIDSLISHNAPDPELYFIHGIINQEMQNYSSAISSYNLALMADEDFYPALINRAYAILEMKQQNQNANQELENVSLGRNTEGRANQPEQDYSAVLDDLSEAASARKDNAIAWYNKGNTELMLQDFTKAMYSYSMALNKNSKLAEAYYNRGLTLIYLQDNHRGCIDLSRAGEAGIEKAYKVIQKYCKE